MTTTWLLDTATTVLALGAAVVLLVAAVVSMKVLLKPPPAPPAAAPRDSPMAQTGGCVERARRRAAQQLQGRNTCFITLCA